RSGRRALERVDHDEQFHQRLVRRRAGWLHDEAVDAADVLADLDVDLAVGEVGDIRTAERDLDELADFVGERTVGVAGEDRERLQHGAGDLPPRGGKDQGHENPYGTRSPSARARATSRSISPVG